MKYEITFKCVKMKYEILELAGLITNFIFEENTEVERERRKRRIYYYLDRLKKIVIRIFNDKFI